MPFARIRDASGASEAWDVAEARQRSRLTRRSEGGADGRREGASTSAQMARGRRSPRSLNATPKRSLVERREEREIKRAAGELKGQKVRGAAERTLTRTFSGAIYAITMVVLVSISPITTTILTAAIAWLCCSEFFRLTRLMGRAPFEFLGLAGAIAFPVAAFIDQSLMNWVLYVLLFASGIWYIFTPRASISDVAVTVFAPLYTGFLISSIVSIRMLDPGSTGALMTLGVLGSIWANDAAAYFCGRRFGRTKMSPRISPNKTWEGFWGGYVGGLILWIVMYIVGLPGITIPIVVIGSIFTMVAGVIGDLVESRIKRAAGVKDSGDFLPGHGGLLDRTDSQLFGCMTGYLILHLGGIL